MQIAVRTIMRTLTSKVGAMLGSSLVLLVAVVLATQQSAVPREMLVRALACISRREYNFTNVPAFAKLTSLEVASLYGILDAADKPNELHILIYGGDHKSAAIYEVLADTHPGKYSFYVVDVASFAKRRHSWDLIETNGGTYSYGRIKRLMAELGVQHPTAFTRSQLPITSDDCTRF